MTTYWMTPSLEELMDWHANAEDTATVQVTVKCAVEGDETVERVYRHKGLSQVNRAFVEELFTPEELDRIRADTVLASDKLKCSGMMGRAQEELDRSGTS